MPGNGATINRMFNFHSRRELLTTHIEVPFSLANPLPCSNCVIIQMDGLRLSQWTQKYFWTVISASRQINHIYLNNHGNLNAKPNNNSSVQIKSLVMTYELKWLSNRYVSRTGLEVLQGWTASKFMTKTENILISNGLILVCRWFDFSSYSKRNPWNKMK